MSSELTKNEAASNIFAAYVKAFRNYFNFKGRTCRYDYWGFAFVNFIILFLLGLVNEIGSNIYCSVMLIPCLAIFVRRLHDINKGFWKWGILPWILICLAAFLFSFPGMGSGIILLGLIIVIYIIALVVALCRKGNPENNKFGNPIDEDESHDRRAKWMIFFALVVPFVLQVFLLVAGGLAGYNKAMQNIQEQQQQQLQSDIKVPQVQAPEVISDAQEQEPETDNVEEKQEAQEPETNDVMQGQEAPAEVEEAEAEDAEESGETEKTEEAEE